MTFLKRYSIISMVMILSLSGLFAGDKSRIKIGGSVIVQKHEEVDDAVAVGGDAKVYGTVNGSAVAVGGDIYLGPDAVIHDDCVSVGGEIRMSQGAVVYGEIVEVDDFNFAGTFFNNWDHDDWHMPWGWTIIPLIAILILGVIIIAIMPKQFDYVTDMIEMEPGKSFLVGVAGMILFIPSILLLLVSLLGIPLIPLFIVSVVLLVFFGYFSAAAVVGQKLLKALGNTSTSTILHIIAGIILLWVVGLIPFAGGLIKTIAHIIGWGAVLVVLYNWKQSRKPQPVTAELPIVEETVEEEKPPSE